MKAEWIDKIYAGWLAKVIGIRLGADIEGFTYAEIKNLFGELSYYPKSYKNFAADDDSNGPFFLLRALEDKTNEILSANDVGNALLNYAPYEHGFFWWGGYGISTEHTAYLNLRNGVSATQSGSIKKNGSTLAEQIGGQIFVDTWGLVCPGNPELAADFARKASSVTHDGNGIHGGVFVAVCISLAFIETDLQKILQQALEFIPKDCEYAKVVNAVIDYRSKNDNDWRDCYNYIFKNFGYDKYPGNCHIIPNIAVMILSLLYGDGDFEKTINICNMCGWDTDCNVGNVATIMGVICGSEAIDYEKWRRPVNDLLICSCTIGSLNILDVPYCASYISKLAYSLDNKTPPDRWIDIFNNKIDGCHFEYEGSTHAIRVKKASNSESIKTIYNTNEVSFTGERSLKISVPEINAPDSLYIYKQTYYTPKDFDDSRYDPAFSPLVYPGQTVHGSIMLPHGVKANMFVSLYARDMRSGIIYKGNREFLKKDEWKNLIFTIPTIENALIDEVGFCTEILGDGNSYSDKKLKVICFVDDLHFDVNANYTIDFKNENVEHWTVLHKEISQMTRLKGNMFLQDELLHLSATDFADAYTGSYNWQNYKVIFALTSILGKAMMAEVRVQGAMRSYSVALLDGNRLAILKNENGYKVIAETPFRWVCDKEYTITVSVYQNRISALVDDTRLEVEDNENPYLNGCVGIGTTDNGHVACRYITIATFDNDKGL